MAKQGLWSFPVYRVCSLLILMLLCCCGRGAAENEPQTTATTSMLRGRGSAANDANTVRQSNRWLVLCGLLGSFGGGGGDSGDDEDGRGEFSMGGAASLPPSASPTTSPTMSSTMNLSSSPPMQNPTKSPTQTPTESPSQTPTVSPTTSTMNLSSSPTQNPTSSPTTSPTAAPSASPTKAPINLALNQAATQSSTAFGGLASRAVDGNTNPKWNGSSVTHTENECSPFWEVTLKDKNSLVEDLFLYNREEYSDRLSGAQVMLIGKAGAVLHIALIGDAEGVPSFHVPIEPPIVAQKVRVQLPRHGRLSLTEVEVFGKAP